MKETETITVNEFIDCITEGKGNQIKKDLAKINKEGGLMEIDKKLQGKRNRAKGRLFELKTRKDLEAKGWIVSKWQNNIDLETGKIGSAKPSRFRLSSTGFPDFICFKSKTINNYIQQVMPNPNKCYSYNLTDRLVPEEVFEIIFVEAKCNGTLSKDEKAKIDWYKLHINIPTIISKKGDKRGQIIYKTKEGEDAKT